MKKVTTTSEVLKPQSKPGAQTVPWLEPLAGTTEQTWSMRYPLWAAMLSWGYQRCPSEYLSRLH